jgi:fucose permease
LLWWNPFPATSILAVGIIGFAISLVFPGLVSGTSARVGDRHAANTIGMQIDVAGLGVSVVPGMAGVLARNTSLEAIPIYLVSLFVVLFGLYALPVRPRSL